MTAVPGELASPSGTAVDPKVAAALRLARYIAGDLTDLAAPTDGGAPDTFDMAAVPEPDFLGGGRALRVLETSPEAILVHDRGVIAYANRAAARVFGADRAADLVGRSVLEIVHQDSRAPAIRRLERLRAGYDVDRSEERAVRLDGRAIDVEIVSAPFEDGDGRALAQMIVRDVSARRRAEQALRDRTTYLAALHETTLALMDHLELQPTLEAIVARAAQLFGTEHGFVYLADTDDDRLVLEVGIGFFSDWMGAGVRLARGEGLAGKVWELDEPLAIEDYDSWEGRSTQFDRGERGSCIGVPLHADGRVVGVLGLGEVEDGRTFTPEEIDLLTRFAALASLALHNARLYTSLQHELAERTLAEEALRESERRFRDMLENVQLFAVVIDMAGAVSFCNDFFLASTGWNRPEVLGRDWFELFTETPAAERDRLIGRPDAALVPGADESLVRTRAGERRLILWSNTVLRDPAGRAIGISRIGEDITDRRHAEQKLREALEQEREAADRLRALDELKTTFLHAVSHELRTPLASVLGFALTLDRDDVELPENERRDMTRRIATNARKLDTMLSDLLDLDRLKRGIVEPRRRPTDVGALVRRTVENSGVFDQRPVVIEAGEVTLPIDAPKVERIIENLFVNAVRHAPPRSEVVVRVEANADGVLLVVEDAGPGVPEELRPIIFEPFRQGPDVPSHSPGVGIGLSLMAQFAKLHGGHAWVQDREGGGASFRVFLPRVPE